METPKNDKGTIVGDGNRNVLLKGNTLYVLNYWIGLQIFDVTNPKKPKELATYRTDSRSFDMIMDAHDHLLIASEGSGVYILDVSNPGKPNLVRRVETSGDAYGLSINGNYLAVAEGDEPIEIFDISNHVSPKKVGSIQIKGWVWSLLYIEGYLYAGTKNKGLFVIDTSDPTNPAVVDHRTFKDDVRKIIVADNIAYIAGGPGGLYIFDVSIPDKPKKISITNISGYLFDVFKSGEFIYAANEKNKQLLVINVVDPLKTEIVYTKDLENKVYGVYKYNLNVYLAQDKYTMTMRYNNPPVFTDVGDKKVDENIILTFKVFASDPDYDPITISGKNLPDGAVFDSTNTFIWSPTFEQSGVYTEVEFIATENTASALKTSHKISIFVNHVNRSPQLDSLKDISADENTSITFVIKSGMDPDKEDTGKLIHRIDNLTEGASFDSLSLSFTWTPTYDHSGTYQLTAVVTDPSGFEAKRPFSITVVHVDRPPVIEKMDGDFTVKEFEVISIDFKGSDPDREDQKILKWNAKNLPEGATFDNKLFKFTWKPTYEQSGVYKDITVFLTTNEFSDSIKFNITVLHVDRPPVFNELAAKQISENDTLRIVFTGSDPDVEDKDKLQFSVSGLPEQASFDHAKAELLWIPGYDQSGEYEITGKITDEAGLFTEGKLKITVNHVNRPPKLNAIEDKQINENEILTFKVSGEDPDKEDISNIILKAENMPEGATFDVNSGEFSWTPTYDQSGEYSFSFIMSDGAGAENKVTVLVKVLHFNRPPVFEVIADQTVPENKEIKFLVKGSDPDKEDAGKTKIAMAESPEGSVFDEAGSSFSWTPTYDQAGDHVVTFEMTDEAGLKTPLKVNIAVTNVNRTPEWVDLTAQSGDEGTAITYQLPKATDPDTEHADKLKYTVTNLPQGASFDEGSLTFSWTPSFDQSGSYEMEFTVSDGEMSVKKSLSVSVKNINQAPEIESIASQTVNEGASLSFTVVVKDNDKEDDGQLKLSVQDLPSGASFDSNSGDFDWEPGFDQSGEYNVKFTVSDKEGLSASTNVRITVADVNRKPELNVSDPGSITAGDTFSMSVSASDPDNDNLQFSLRRNPGGMQIDNSGGISWSDASPGSYTVTVTVSDGKGGEDSGSFTLQVDPKPVPVPEPDPEGNEN